jgi:thiamine biosynthesis lipoprotein
MGTIASLHLISSNLAQAAFDQAAAACWAELDDLERIFSPHDERSEIRRLASGELMLGEANPLVSTVAEDCEEARERTRGLFDPWSKGWFNPTGYVKGWAAERVAERYLAPLLASLGVDAIGLWLGGDIWLRTNSDSDWVWQVAIADPHHPGGIKARLEIKDGAVATSGIAERGLHIDDPRTGEPATTVASASVIADRLVDADLWATTAVVAGFDNLDWISQAGTRAGLLVANNGRTRRWVGAYELVEAGNQ